MPEKLWKNQPLPDDGQNWIFCITTSADFIAGHGDCLMS
jgi:hypothetical protein